MEVSLNALIYVLKIRKRFQKETVSTDLSRPCSSRFFCNKTIALFDTHAKCTTNIHITVSLFKRSNFTFQFTYLVYEEYFQIL